MRKVVLALTLVLGLAGCANIQNAYNAITTLSTPRTNPITKTDLNNIESAATLVFAGLNVYRRSCEKGAIPESCIDVIHRIQVYTRQIKPYLRSLRTFVKSNDQVNAVSVYNAIVKAIADAKNEAAANGIQVGG